MGQTTLSAVSPGVGVLRAPAFGFDVDQNVFHLGGIYQ